MENKAVLTRRPRGDRSAANGARIHLAFVQISCAAWSAFEACSSARAIERRRAARRDPCSEPISPRWPHPSSADRVPDDVGANVAESECTAPVRASRNELRSHLRGDRGRGSDVTKARLFSREMHREVVA